MTNINYSPSFYVPEYILKMDEFRGNFRNKSEITKRDKVLWLIDRITRRKAIDHTFYDKDKKNLSHWLLQSCQIHSDILKEYMGPSTYRGIIRELEEMNVISSSDYVEGVKSKLYKLNIPPENYGDLEICTVHVEDITLKRKLRRTKDLKLTQINRNPAHKYIYKNLIYSTFDKKGLREYFNSIPNDRKTLLPKIKVDMMLRKDFFFRVDDAGRVHNNFTCLNKELRNFILIDGEPTVEIDISNCMPYLMLSLYDGELERIGYADMVTSGQFYEYINRKAGSSFDPVSQRDLIKEKAFKEILFGYVHDMYPYWRAFKKQFPRLANKIISIKNGNHRNLAQILQTLEASTMIGQVIPELKKHSIPALTIHDGLRVKASDMELAKAITTEMLNKLTGFQPDINTSNN